MLGRVCQAIRDGVDGLKTLIVAAFFVGLGLADYADVVNVKPLLDYLIGDDKKVAKIMVLMPVVFGTLRFLSSSGPRWSKRWRDERGYRNVDTPKGEEN